MRTQTTSATHITTTTPNRNPNSTPARSIREICLTGILHGRSTEEIAKTIVEHHPASAAAAKSGKHISWYRSWMKKEGLLPEQMIEAGIEERHGCDHPSGLAI